MFIINWEPVIKSFLISPFPFPQACKILSHLLLEDLFFPGFATFQPVKLQCNGGEKIQKLLLNLVLVLQRLRLWLFPHLCSVWSSQILPKGKTLQGVAQIKIFGML